MNLGFTVQASLTSRSKIDCRGGDGDEGGDGQFYTASLSCIDQIMSLITVCRSLIEHQVQN